MAASRPAYRYPKGSRLRCRGCGYEGSDAQVIGHQTRPHRCHGQGIDVISYPPGVTAVVHDVSQAVAAPRGSVAEGREVLGALGQPQPSAEEMLQRLEGEVDRGRAPAGAVDDPGDPDGGDGDDEDDENDEGGDDAQPPAPASVAGNGATPPRRKKTTARERSGLEVRQPPPGGAAEVQPTTARVVIELWGANLARYDACRMDRDLAYAGSISDLVNEVLEVHFTDCLGLDLGLFRRRPVQEVA